MDPLLKSLSDDQLGGLIREQRPEWALPLGRGRPEVAAPYNEEGPPLPARMQELRGEAAEAYTRTQDPAQGQRSFFRQALDAVLALGDARAREKLPRPYDVAEGFLNPVPGVAGVLMGAKGAKALGPNTEIKYLLGRKALDEGEAPQAVWSKYGVSKTPEGAYVFEAPLMEGETDAIRQFMQAYPNVALRVLRGQGPREGYYYDKSPEIFAQGKTTGPITDFDSRRRVLEHELQHAADAAEGHSYGTNLQDPNYMKNAAEVRARAVEERLDPRERVWEPSFHEDVDRLDQVIKRHPGAVSEAVKEKGGMWHPEAVERLSQPLFNQLGANIALDRVYEGLPHGAAFKEAFKNSPEGQWSDRAIRNYLNKHAGTATDPLKDVEIPFGEGVKRWEDITDNVIGQRKLGDLPERMPIPSIENLDKLERMRQEPIYGLIGLQPDFSIRHGGAGPNANALTSYLSHVGDYLRQNVPAEKLQQYDLVRAVKETAANDARVAKEMEKAAQASMKDMPVYKEYPDGMKWVELKKPEALSEGQVKSVRKLSRDELENELDMGDVLDEAAEGWVALGADGKPLTNSYTGGWATAGTKEEAFLAGQLAQEGNQMGHCVGGYCEDVARGESRIFSLRDAKGRSHVTVEVEPKGDVRRYTPEEWYMNLASPELQKKLGDFHKLPIESEARRNWRKEVFKIPEYEAWLSSRPENITQIKGKQNRAPVAEYLPYVQDFVKSGKWGEVGDLRNTGLRKHRKTGEYVTEAELKFKDPNWLFTHDWD